MKICPTCSIENKESAHYCKSCGTRLVLPYLENAESITELKEMYTDSVSKIKELESQVKEIGKTVRGFERFKSEVRTVDEISKKLESRDSLEKELDRKMLKFHSEIEDQIKDAKYYKLNSVNKFRGDVDSLSNRIKFLEKAENDTDQKISFAGQKFEKEVRSLRENINKLEKAFDRTLEENEKILKNLVKKFKKDLDIILEKKSNAFTRNLGFKLENDVSDLSAVINKKLPLIKEYEDKITRLQKDVRELKHEIQELRSFNGSEFVPIPPKPEPVPVSKPVINKIESAPGHSYNQGTSKSNLNEMEQRIRELENMLRKSMSNVPIIIE